MDVISALKPSLVVVIRVPYVTRQMSGMKSWRSRDSWVLKDLGGSTAEQEDKGLYCEIKRSEIRRSEIKRLGPRSGLRLGLRTKS